MNSAISKDEHDAATLAVATGAFSKKSMYFAKQLDVLKLGLQFRAQLLFLENLGSDAEKRAAADQGKRKLMHLLDTRQRLLDEFAKIQDMETVDGLDCEDVPMFVLEHSLAPSLKSDVDASAPLWSDLIHIDLHEKRSNADKILKTLSETTEDMELKETPSSWKAKVENPEDLKSIMHTASTTIALLKGGQVTKTLNELSKALPLDVVQIPSACLLLSTWVAIAV